MIDLYSLNYALRIVMSCLCLVGMLVSALGTIFTAQSKNRNLLCVLYECSTVYFFFTSTFLCSLVTNEINNELYISNMDFLRYFIIPGVCLAFVKGIKFKSAKAFAACAMLLINLPFFDKVTPHFYSAVFVASNCIFFVASLDKLIFLRKELLSNISSLSIKEALDIIPDGLLFADKKGRILLENNKITSILYHCGINPLLNAKIIYDKLKSTKTSEYCTCVDMEKALLLRFLNGGAYLVTFTPLKYKNRRYWQLFASDITEEDILTKELGDYTLHLMETQKDIVNALKTIEETQRLKELLRLKSNIHDIIGERLSIIHRFLEDMPEKYASGKKLKELFDNLENELHMAFSAAPLKTFEDTKNLFEIIGVKINLEGRLPQDENTKSIIIQIIREASTNAVRHGNAKNINVKTYCDSRFHISIENDGKVPEKDICEGNGIKGIREKLAKIKGELHYETKPQFCLYIIL